MISALSVDRSFSSPNHGERVGGGPIDHLVLHYTGMRTEEGARDWLCNPVAQVSSHYVVYEDGRIFQLVDEARRAWHAGRSFWRGVTDLNSRSIGIEICNPGHEFGYRPFPDRQIAVVLELCRDILARHAIPPHQVVAHSDIAPTRKDDPGEFFPWDVCAKSGIGLWAPEAVEGELADLPEFLRLCGEIGFGIHHEDTDSTSVIRAFQRHWRMSRVDGHLDAITMATARRVHALFPPFQTVAG
ncbi:N-acetylmuramoyl-L-alanine amidase [Oryzibacter oryziterrae]|uniref:N-acetylmuramoyl-L-alanine amidase n=1 Tax=Oryzibacter oryziterrae TaxID=2766474 RepID=UPI001F25BAE1|nr:N-acetylmuramoyl-L-alanine amidase [Oryzibacter oryziterrae]